VSTRSFSSLATFHCHVAYNYAHNFCTVSLPSHKQWDILIGKQRHKLSKFVLPLTYSSRHSSEASKHTKITLRLHNCWIFSRSAAISIPLFMAALRSRCGHYIFCPVFSFFLFLSFSLVSSQPSQIGFLPYFHTWCGLSANFRCRSETCCMRFAEIQDVKNRNLRTIAQLCRAISTHLSTIGKKLVKQQYPPTCPPYNMVNFGPLALRSFR